MQIVIPTYRRANRLLQSTANTLIEAGIKPTLVIRQDDTAYMDAFPDKEVHFHVLPFHPKGIADTRDYIIHDMEGSRTVCMLDDDLRFAVRRTDDRTKFRPAAVSDIVTMLDTLANAVDYYPHASIGAREGGNRNTQSRMWNTRMMRVLAYDRRVLKEKMLTLHPMTVMEDFHMTLSLLRHGYDCPVLNDWVSDQIGGSQSRGGCADFRTPEVQAANAERLAYLHPGYVKVVKKTTKTAWGGGERTDVLIQWKKARAGS